MQPIDTRDTPGEAADERLVDGVARREPRAFDAIVLRYSGELLRYARRLGLAEHAAEDVLQQSLLKAWVSLDAGTDVRALRPWLYRIVHNNSVNALTRQREVPSVLEEDVHPEFAEGGLPHLDRVLDVRAALADVVALPRMQRDAILLSAVDGRSHDEVAEVLGVSDGAVRGLLHRARRTLRAAAAVVVPPPLIAWCGGNAARLAPTAGRIAEGAGPGGSFEAGTELAKGAALAAAAAVLVAGVATVHPHGRPVSTRGQVRSARVATTDGVSSPVHVEAAPSNSAARRPDVVKSPTSADARRPVTARFVVQPNKATVPVVGSNQAAPTSQSEGAPAVPGPAPAGVAPPAAVPGPPAAARGRPASGGEGAAAREGSSRKGHEKADRGAGEPHGRLRKGRREAVQVGSPGGETVERHVDEGAPVAHQPGGRPAGQDSSPGDGRAHPSRSAEVGKR